MSGSGNKPQTVGPLVALGAIGVIGVGVLLGLGVEMGSDGPGPKRGEGPRPVVVAPPASPELPPPEEPPVEVEPATPEATPEAPRPETSPWADDPEFLRALQRTEPPPPVAPEAIEVVSPGFVPAPPISPRVSAEPEPSPIQVDHGRAGVIVRSAAVTRTLNTVGDAGVPVTKQLRLEGFDVAISGPGNYQQTRSYGPADMAVLGTEPGLADGLYKYSVRPRLQRISRLPGKIAAVSGDDTTVVLDANGRNALDPDVAAAANLPRVEGTSGSFRIAGGQLVQPDQGSEPDPYTGATDQDPDR